MLATPPPSLRDKITGRYGQAAYLGPEVASGSHIVQFRLRDGSYKVARSARIRMVVPVTFEFVLDVVAAGARASGPQGL